MSKKALAFLIGSLALAALESLWLRPILEWDLRSLTVFSFLLSANLFYAYNLAYQILRKPRWVLGAYLAWYVLLFLFFMAVSTGPAAERIHFGGMHRLLLFGLFLLITSACFHVPSIFGFLVVVLITYFIFPFFAEATLGVLCVLYMVGLAMVGYARRTSNYTVLACFLIGFVLLLVVLFPMVNLVTWRSSQDLDGLLRGTDPSAVDTRSAIVTSLTSATVSTLIVIVLGVPLAYFLVRSEFRGRAVLDALVDLPIVLPPPAAGIALALLVGRNQAFGKWLDQQFGIVVDGAWIGIVLAQVFVSSPFLIRSAMAAFRAVDPKLENVSRTLGASSAWTFLCVSLPLALRGIFMGSILAWGRAIGEFGSVVILAATPVSMPVHIYNEFNRSGVKGASTSVSILIVLISTLVFAMLHLLASRTLWRGVRTVWSSFGDSRRPTQ